MTRDSTFFFHVCLVVAAAIALLCGAEASSATRVGLVKGAVYVRGGAAPIGGMDAPVPVSAHVIVRNRLNRIVARETTVKDHGFAFALPPGTYRLSVVPGRGCIAPLVQVRVGRTTRTTIVCLTA